MGKLESLIRLDSMGLNTPELLLEIPRFKDDRIERWLDFYRKAKGRVSIRTERDGEFKCPHFPNVTIRTAHKHMQTLLEEGYRILVFRAINPKDCLHCGNIAFQTPDQDPIIEWNDGPGTCRDLEKRVQHRAQGSALSHPKVNNIIMTIEAWSFHTKQVLDNMILEWSIYPYPVGKRKENQIFWEIRPWR